MSTQKSAPKCSHAGECINTLWYRQMIKYLCNIKTNELSNYGKKTLIAALSERDQSTKSINPKISHM